VWKGSITPLRGSSCVSCNRIRCREGNTHLTVKTCNHKHNYYTLKERHNYRRDGELSPLHKRTSGCKGLLDTAGDPIICN
jgi:hypothetical protein